MFRNRYLLLVSLTLTIAKPAGAVVSAELYRSTPHTYGRDERARVALDR